LRRRVDMGLLTKLRNDERGISAVIVAVSLVGILGAALLSVDAGNMWQTRRTIIRGTDATALDQAIFAAKTGATDCSDTATTFDGVTYQAWTEIMQVNTAGFEFVDGIDPDCEFQAHPTIPGAGYVTVQSRKIADTRFGGIFGLGETKPYSFSAAQIGYPTAIKGLRPIGLCILNDHFQEWLAYEGGSISESAWLGMRGTAGHPTSKAGRSYGTGLVHRVLFEKDQPDECGADAGSPGNWGFLDFDGGGNPSGGEGSLADWFLNGYDGLVSAPDDCDADGTSPDPAGGAGDQCNGDPGAVGGNDTGACNTSNTAGAMRCIMSTPTNLKEFPIVVFDSAADCQPGGAGGENCKYDIARYVFIRLWGFELGSNGNFDVEFVPGVATGVCCETNPTQTDIKVVLLCAVDHDTSGMSVAARCGQ
jgi:hypothetical protein